MVALRFQIKRIRCAETLFVGRKYGFRGDPLALEDEMYITDLGTRLGISVSEDQPNLSEVGAKPERRVGKLTWSRQGSWTGLLSHDQKRTVGLEKRIRGKIGKK